MNLYLIGYRGSGKSTVAPHLAKRLGWNCVDADDLVEAEAGKSIAAIFADSGESEFRRMESEVIETLSKKSELIVSLGGGAPTFEVNQKRIASSGKSVYLSASLDLLWARISGDQTSVDRRPDLTDLGGRAEVEQLMSVRAPICLLYTSPSPRDS